VKLKVKDIISVIEQHFPPHIAETWDNVGLQIGSVYKPVEKAIVALDLDEEVLQQALRQGADMVITHHPLFFNPVKKIDYGQPLGRLIREVIRADICVYSVHTNLDAADSSLSQQIAELLELRNIEPLNVYKKEELYKLVVFVPHTHINEVRKAVNEAGAGYIGKYSDCSFRTRGIGTFCPEEGTVPYIGEQGILEEVEEYRLETVVYQRDLGRVLRAMNAAHPYEEVAYDIYRLENAGRVFSMGRKGVLGEEMSLKLYAEKVKKSLGVSTVRVVGSLDRIIKKVAVVSGAGAGLIDKALAEGADLLITGDLKYHEAKNAEAWGLAVIDAGHQGTEEIAASYLCRLLAEECRARGFMVEFIPAYSSSCFKYV